MFILYEEYPLFSTNFSSDKIKYKMFMERPLFLGISGSTGRKYEDIRKKHEIIIDFLCKTNIYNNEILWNIIASCKNKRVTDK